MKQLTLLFQFLELKAECKEKVWEKAEIAVLNNVDSEEKFEVDGNNDSSSEGQTPKTNLKGWDLLQPATPMSCTTSQHPQMFSKLMTSSTLLDYLHW